MSLRGKIVNAYDVEGISESYQGPVEITDLREELGTKGHVLVVRGDKAYLDRLSEDEADIATPKLWLYENLIKSQEVQEQLRLHPNHKLFDGVSNSSLAALGYHAQQLNRKTVVVMADVHVPTQEIVDRYGIEVISAIGPAEEGYVKAQADVIKHRDDIIPLHQALYGARALAPIGNSIVKQLKHKEIEPDATFWCLASGANLYGVGSKIKQTFPDCQTIVVEPVVGRTLEGLVDLSDPLYVREFAKRKSKSNLNEWVKQGKYITLALPLHASIPNRYLLDLWRATGKTGIDGLRMIGEGSIQRTQDMLRHINSDYDWTPTTALTLIPAIHMAEEGKDVLVMAYGKNRKAEYRDCFTTETPWILRWATPAQKIAASLAAASYLTLAGLVQIGFARAFEEHPEVMKYFPFIN